MNNYFKYTSSVQLPDGDSPVFTVGINYTNIHNTSENDRYLLVVSDGAVAVGDISGLTALSSVTEAEFNAAI